MPISSLFKAFRSNASSTKAVRVAVIGAGRMGQHHVRHLSRIRGAKLVGVVDTEAGRSRPLAKKYKTAAYSHPSYLLGQTDAVVIATPTPTHFALGKMFLEAGISCLVEKPLALTVDEAEALIEVAERNRRILQVGHIERFNPAVLEAGRYVDRPRFIEVNRLGPYDPRVADIGVILDLMIHDLDIVLFLVGEPVVRVEAYGAKVLSQHEDIAKVRLHFKSGCVADLSASRVSIQKYRKIRIFQHNAYLSLDYAAPQLQVYRKRADVVRSLRDIDIVKPRLAKNDPLAAELEHFVGCVRDGRTPLVSGQHGRDALELAREILESLKIDG